MTTKKEQKVAEKVADAKKNAKSATKIKAQNDRQKAADKMLVSMANELPAGQAKSLIQVTHAIDKLEEQRKTINLAIKGQRAILKEMKIDLEPYDHVRKLRKKDPEDVKYFKATVAMYENQLQMELSPSQKEDLEAINKKREEARLAMAEVNGGDTGKEMGSAATTIIPAALPTIPQRNDALSEKFRSPFQGTAH